jgi:hypothetical protein
MRTEDEIRKRLEQVKRLENTTIRHLRVQRYHEGNILEWVLNDTPKESEVEI